MRVLCSWIARNGTSGQQSEKVSSSDSFKCRRLECYLAVPVYTDTARLHSRQGALSSVPRIIFNMAQKKPRKCKASMSYMPKTIRMKTSRLFPKNIFIIIIFFISVRCYKTSPAPSSQLPPPKKKKMYPPKLFSAPKNLVCSFVYLCLLISDQTLKLFHNSVIHCYFRQTKIMEMLLQIKFTIHVTKIESVLITNALLSVQPAVSRFTCPQNN